MDAENVQPDIPTRGNHARSVIPSSWSKSVIQGLSSDNLQLKGMLSQNLRLDDLVLRKTKFRKSSGRVKPGNFSKLCFSGHGTMLHPKSKKYASCIDGVCDM